MTLIAFNLRVQTESFATLLRSQREMVQVLEEILQFLSAEVVRSERAPEIPRTPGGEGSL